MKKRKFWKDIRLFFEPIKFFKKEYLQVTFQKFFDSLFVIWSVWFLEQSINAIENGNVVIFKKYLLIYVLSIIIFHPITYLIRYRTWNFYPETKKFLDKKYIWKFLIMDNNEAEWIGTGRIIAIVEKWLSQWIDLLKITFLDGVKSFFTILFGFVYIGIIIGWQIVFVFIGIVILGTIIHFLNQKAIRYRNKRRDVQHSQMRLFVKIIMSKFEILQSKKKDLEIENMWNFHDEWYIFHKKTIDFMNIVFSLPIFLLWILTTIIVWTYGNAVFSSWSWFGELTALLVVLGLIGKILWDMVDFYRRFTKERVHLEKLFDLFDNAKYMDKYEKWKPFIFQKGHIEIKNLSYKYPKAEKIFDKFNLTIEWMKKTALVGISWSGKSTLVKLIAGFLTTNKWSIIIDWQKINSFSLQSYYKHIWYLTQEPSVFDGTIRENLVYAVAEDIEEEAIQKAIKLAKCDFIYKFKDGVNTEIWEKWIRLSGGQRQRLAIAKIFLKNPEIIILDEPTSALDSFAEEKITEAMHNLYKNRTVIIVAHRLQTVKEADDIIVLDEWKIIERWTHKNLTKKKWYYAKMLELQSGF